MVDLTDYFRWIDKDFYQEYIPGIPLSLRIMYSIYFGETEPFPTVYIRKRT